MSKRRLFVLRLKHYRQVMHREGKVRCSACGEDLKVGDKVLSKQSSHGAGIRPFTKRYHWKCAKKLLIWA